MKEVASRVQAGVSSEQERRAVAGFAISILNTYLGVSDANDPINMSAVRIEGSKQGASGDQVSFGAGEGFQKD